jgi:hypothetical protein
VDELKDVNWRRRSGTVMPDRYGPGPAWAVADDLADRVDTLYAKTHRQTGAQSTWGPLDTEMLVDSEKHADSLDAMSDRVRRVQPFRALYSATDGNIAARRYQEDVIGVQFPPRSEFGVDVRHGG